MKTSQILLPTTLIFAMAAAGPLLAEPVEWDEFNVIIETNATDGDVGFHALADGEAWRWIRLDDPDGNTLFGARARNGLMDQGLTEVFFESAEPLCVPDDEEPDEPVSSLANFLSRFPEGEYTVRGSTNEDDFVFGEAEFNYDIPAAPDISMTDETEQYIHDVVLGWDPGTDLGEKCHDQSLIDDGTITDHAEVPIIGWEVVVEPGDEDAADPLRVYAVQLPPGQTSVRIPEGFLWMLFDEGFTEFKFEVGAKEESGNQTFSEGTFTVHHDYPVGHVEPFYYR